MLKFNAFEAIFFPLLLIIFQKNLKRFQVYVEQGRSFKLGKIPQK